MQLSVETLTASALRRWRLVALVTTVCTIAAIVVALLLRPVYRSEVVVAPVVEDPMSGLGSLAGQFGGIAALAGLSLGKTQNRDEAVGLLQSNALVQKFIVRDNLMPVLFEKKWDAHAGRWRADLKRTPTMGDALLKFDRNILQVREDPKTGLLTVRVDWYDRFAAAKWANELVAMANEELRARAIADATAAIDVLNRELRATDSVELRSAISRLIEAQMRTRTFALVRREYMFRTVDPAIPADPDKRQRPTRSLIAIAGCLGGAMLGVLIAFLLDLRRARP